MEDSVIKFENISKKYRLGLVGGTTLKEELQRLGARLRKQEDPTSIIGQDRLPSSELQNENYFWALKDIDLDIARGETLGIIGRNGAGKSTLLKLLCRITAPTTGTISYNGRIASMLEVGTGFHGELTGRENIYLNGAILGMNRREVTSKIDKIIDFSECGKFIDTPVKRYSSGMYVKLAFSVAAFLDAEIMIMDEVLAVGDAVFQKKCIERMRELARQEQRTVLYVSHILPTVTELCDRTIVLKQGRIDYVGKTEDAINHYLEHDFVSDTCIDYTTINRNLNPAKQSIRLLQASFVDKDTAVFYDNEAVNLSLKFRYLADCTGASFRLEIRTPEGRPVATSIKKQFLSGKAGETANVLLKYDFPELVEGRYITHFTFCFCPEGVDNKILESVEGLSFEKKYLEIKTMNWNYSKWGNICLSAPEVLKNRE